MSMKRNQAGASLIETMVALFVLAIGLLGFAALLTNSLTMNQRAFTLSQAMFAANNLTERMRINRDFADKYAILKSEDPASSPTDCSTNTCTPTQLAEWDQKEWFDLLNSSLPGADASVEVVTTAGGEISVTVYIEYELSIGRAGTGSAAEVAAMKSTIAKLDNYELRTEI